MHIPLFHNIHVYNNVLFIEISIFSVIKIINYLQSQKAFGSTIGFWGKYFQFVVVKLL